MASPARLAAFRALRALASPHGDLGDALAQVRSRLTDARDRALTTDLVLGTLRWRGAIDFQLQRASSKPLARLDAAVLDALRLGAYQILYLERVPISAAVNDTVTIVKAAGFLSAAGFANAVLRRLSRERETLTWPPRPAQVAGDGDRRTLIEHLAVLHSHPAWIVERWLHRYGMDETEVRLAFNNRAPAITLAANRFRGTRDQLAERLANEGVTTIPTRHAPHGLIVSSGRALASQAFLDGACVVQDEASQVVAELVAAADGHRVLDACASPGGKTIALAAQCRPTGMVVAADVRHRRVALLAETLRRCRIPSTHVLHIAGHSALPIRDAVFNRVLVDAPCSGLGTLRRDPDIRWRRDPGDLAPLAAAQGELLRRLGPLVADGGRLVYTTCSSEPEENEEVIHDFLARAPAFRVLPVAAIGGLGDSVRAMATPEGYLRTSAHHGLEAFFGAIMEKRL